ncbi:caffeic acid 3-O-methyltransferase-like [Gastrolobium bilobum]|uniref:caffeic acid 3-O-methyltransferase-like n=1 Tax=Gastrolobium bilobum TaxID=150636 RepID=UPI002AB30710|nr:caffeic acid 3-O-methyltransferase-like [Gastrolobium bilobum]
MGTHLEFNGVEAKQHLQRKGEIEDEAENYSYAIQMVNSIALPMSLHAILELGVLDIIQKAGPDAKVSAKDIAAQISCKNPDAPTMLDRILMLLSSYSVLHCSVVDADGDDESGSFKRLYSLNSVSRYLVPNQDGVSLKPLMALIHDKVFLQNWSQLKEAILEGGIPFNRVHGMHAFEYPSFDPRFNQVFNAAMSNATRIAAKKILESYKGFEHINKVVDVGGGLGTTLSFVVSKYPHIQGINYDLPHVIKEAPSYPGVTHVGGDMFESVPHGDAIIMKLILHDWSDERCLKLLKNCYNAIPDNGKVIIVEQILPAMPENSTKVKAACQTDVLMMTQNPGGKERSEEEFMELATRSGFSGVRYECFANDLRVMEFFK